MLRYCPYVSNLMCSVERETCIECSTFKKHVLDRRKEEQKMKESEVEEKEELKESKTKRFLYLIKRTIQFSNPFKHYSYHDTIVIVNGKKYDLFNSSYGYRLMCSRASGWELWHIWGDEEKLIGGEYNGDDFRIEVAGRIVCG